MFQYNRIILELTAAQTLVARISGIGLASAVFIYYLVKLLVKPFIDVRLETNPYGEFATNAATAVMPSGQKKDELERYQAADSRIIHAGSVKPDLMLLLYEHGRRQTRQEPRLTHYLTEKEGTSSSEM